MTTSKSLPAIALPLMVSFTLRFLFTLVDLFFAAMISEADNSAVAAIGLWAPFQFVFIAIWVGMSGGFTAALSQAFGSRDEDRVGALKRAMVKLLSIMIPALALLGIGLWFWIPTFGLEADLTEAFRTYATTLAIGMPLTGFWSMYPDSIVKAHQATRVTMVAGLLSSVTNVVLNAWFALGLSWGLFGIALATVISRFPALAYAMYHAHRLERHRLQQSWQPIPTSWTPPVATILKLAVPGAVTFLLAGVENGIINKVLTGLPDSTTAIATFGVYDRMLMFALMPASATAIAVVPFVAHLLPAGAIDRIRHDLRRTLLLVAGISLAITVLVGWIVAEPVAGFLIKSDSGTEASPVALEVLRLLPLGALSILPFLVLRPTFEAANEPRLGVLVSALRYLGLSIPLAVLASWFAPRLPIQPLMTVVLALITAGALASAATAWFAGTTLRRAAPSTPI